MLFSLNCRLKYKVKAWKSACLHPALLFIQFIVSSHPIRILESEKYRAHA
ncbi:hypothetical protein Plhal304r1_c011g0043771 [Plasmopara halstedii]